MTKALRIAAQSPEDLTILSASLQDAILRIGDISYQKSAHALSLRISRFSHEHQGQASRILAGLRFDGVLGIKARGLDRSDPDNLCVLLGLHFEHGETFPEGELYLIFAGGGEICMQVECIDAILTDVAKPRQTDKIPLHPLD